MHNTSDFIDLFNIEILLIQIDTIEDDTEHTDLVDNHLSKLLKVEDIDLVRKALSNRDHDEGWTFHSIQDNHFTSIFLRMTTKHNGAYIYGREKRRLENMILKQLGINDPQTAAYLAGYLSPLYKKLFDDSKY